MPKPPDLPAEGEAAPLTYDPEIGPGYFVQTRSDFLRFGGYSPTFKILYQILLSYVGAGVKAWPGQVRLAAECGVSERTIRTVLGELETAGLLRIERRGLNLTNAYHLHKLPLVLRPVVKDRQNLPVQTGNHFRSKPATIADKVESVQIDSAETVAPPSKNGSAPPQALTGWLYMIATDTARELHLAGDVPRRILAAWHESGLDEAAMADRLYQARTLARKARGDRAGAYWAAVEQG